ncbi:hypothetical protein [Pseudobacillus badius]|uniref:hypothetical protein n=1 Tax=Bacillus badius TaxID=1455 RepID=UPI0005ADBD33|nr:hypothetical protein [Bacillus badius]KIL73863.1 hypothetical protein SD78_2921 [Bacillus badius]MED0668069.1 hypothetical protein [Bacillus badius]UAT32948.1 hypothetical protein K7T73_20105 [Bacillus badius]GLY11967.1 hypothetical protein Bbad01_31830 [Bacillus badius]
MKLKINREIENKFYIGFFLFIGLCFAVFFTSRLWMYDDNPIMQTPYNMEITGLDQTNLVLQKWEYNPNEQLMEVMLKTKHVGTDQVRPTFSFAAKEKDSKEIFPVKVVYKDEETVVLQIKKVPETYRYIGLFVRENRDPKIIENEINNTLSEGTGTLYPDAAQVKSSWPKPKETIVIGDYRKIKLNKELKNNSTLAYKKEQIMLEIEQVKKEIVIIQNERIPLQEQLISSIKEEIKTLKSEMKYKTEEEKQEAYTKIVSQQEAIKKAEKQQQDYLTEVKQLQEKEAKLYEKLNDVESKAAAVNDKKEIKSAIKLTKNEVETGGFEEGIELK